MVREVSALRAEGTRFAVRWLEGDRPRCFSRADREPVETKRAQLLAAASNIGVPVRFEVPAGAVGTASWWQAMLLRAAAVAVDAFNAQDGPALNRAKKLAACLDEVSRSAAIQDEHRRAIDELAALTSYVRELQRLRDERRGDAPAAKLAPEEEASMRSLLAEIDAKAAS